MLDSKLTRYYILSVVLNTIIFVIYSPHKCILGDEIFYHRIGFLNKILDGDKKFSHLLFFIIFKFKILGDESFFLTNVVYMINF